MVHITDARTRLCYESRRTFAVGIEMMKEVLGLRVADDDCGIAGLGEFPHNVF